MRAEPGSIEVGRRVAMSPEHNARSGSSGEEIHSSELSRSGADGAEFLRAKLLHSLPKTEIAGGERCSIPTRFSRDAAAPPPTRAPRLPRHASATMSRKLIHTDSRACLECCGTEGRDF